MHREVRMHESRTATDKTFRNRVVPIVGYIYTSIYYCCKSFPVLLHDVMWVSGSLRTCSFLFFGLGATAFRVDRARRGNVCLQDQAKACSPTDQPVRKFKDGLGLSLIHI